MASSNTPATEVTSMVDIIGNGAPSGASFGGAITDKISFYGVTPVAQRSGSIQAAVTTTAATGTTFYGFTTTSQANNAITLLNEIRATLVAAGLMKGSA